MLGELIECAWRELCRRKWRTGTTVLGYFLAVGLTVGLAVAMWARREAANQVLSTTGTHFVAFAPASAGQGARPPLDYLDPQSEGLIAVGNNEVPASLLPADLAARVKQIPAVKDASGCLLFRFKDSKDGHLFTVAGIDAGGNLAVGTTCCAATDVLDGRYLAPDAEQGVMIEEAYAKSRGIGVDQRISVAGRQFEVVGIVNSGIRPAKADVYMPIQEAERLVNSRLQGDLIERRFNVLLVEALTSDVQDDAMRQVKAIDPRLVISTYACYRPAAQVMGMNETAIRILVLLVALGALLFAAKSQLASVLERRRDIGVLKTLGWSSREVLTLVLAESVIQGLIGGALGGAAAALGLLLTGVAAPGSNGLDAASYLVLLAGVLGAGVFLALVGGVLAGAVPGVLACRVSPAEAIRKL